MNEINCKLELSTDQQWVHVIVDGKKIVTFHANYVRKIIDSKPRSEPVKYYNEEDCPF